MSDIKDVFNDIMSFADRHGLEPAHLMRQVADARPVVRAEPLALPLVSLPDAAEPSEDDKLVIVKRYWSRQEIGYSATAAQVYAECGFAFAKNSRMLSHWMNSAEASALVVGERGGCHVYVRVDPARVS